MNERRMKRHTQHIGFACSPVRGKNGDLWLIDSIIKCMLLLAARLSVRKPWPAGHSFDIESPRLLLG